jgi:GNAT superfamily N-acetyltransferase
VDEPALYRFEETLKDGTSVVLRAIHPDDRERIRNAFRKLERETIYTRFFGPKSELSDRELTHFTVVDFHRDVALLVTIRSNDEEIVIGSACYFSVADGASERAAEIAFTVEEDYHRRGIASLLMKHLVHVARKNGFVRLEAYVLDRNRAMLEVFNRSPLRKSFRREDGVVHVTFFVQEEPSKPEPTR